MKELISEVKAISSLVNRVQELENCKAINERVTSELSDENKRLNQRINEMEIQVDDQEQRSRNGCLLIHGVEEQDDDNTDNIALEIINKDLEVELTIDGIQRSHRVGPRKSNRNTRSSKSKPRPIIVRFANGRKRREVFLSKRKLKGKNISISETLPNIDTIFSEKLRRSTEGAMYGRTMDVLQQKSMISMSCSCVLRI